MKQRLDACVPIKNPFGNYDTREFAAAEERARADDGAADGKAALIMTLKKAKADAIILHEP
jgi:hypothetical protein